MSIIALLLPLIALEPSLSPDKPLTLAEQVERQYQRQFPGDYEESQEAESVFFHLNEPLLFQPQKFTLEFSDTDWLIRRREVIARVIDELQAKAFDGGIVVYRVTNEPVEDEGKRSWRVTVIFDA